MAGRIGVSAGEWNTNDCEKGPKNAKNVNLRGVTETPRD